MIDMSEFEQIDPYVRMMRLKREASLSGKWRDIDHVFTYIASGTADFILNGKHYPLHAGNAIIIPPYMTHVIVASGPEHLVQYIIHFDLFATEERKKLVHKDVLEEADRNLVLDEREAVLGNRVLISDIPESKRNRMMTCYLNMMREFNEDRPGRSLVLRSGCLEILVLTLRNCVDVGEAENPEEKKTKAWMHIENAVNYIQRSDLTERLDNGSIAAGIGVSPNYLTKVFQTHLGLSLHKYVLNVRMEKAQKLLLSGKVNITEAANMTGFSSIHVFSKTFKNIIGISPSQFLDEVVNRERFADSVAEYEKNE